MLWMNNSDKKKWIVKRPSCTVFSLTQPIHNKNTFNRNTCWALEFQFSATVSTESDNTISLSKIDKKRKYTSKRWFIKVYLLLSTFLPSFLPLFMFFCSSCTAFWFAKYNFFTNFKMTVNAVSRFGKEPIYLVSQSKLFDAIVRHSIEISDDHPNAKNIIPLQLNAHEQQLSTSPSLRGISITLTPGLHPRRRFALAYVEECLTNHSMGRILDCFCKGLYSYNIHSITSARLTPSPSLTTSVNQALTKHQYNACINRISRMASTFLDGAAK